MSNELITRSTGSAIDIRRGRLSAVIDKLSYVDGRIYRYSTDKQIKDYSDKELLEMIERVTKMIYFDIGYTPSADKSNAAFEMTRLHTILRAYYAYYTMTEFKLAFELCAMGELDRFLPKDSQGNPDRKHYQHFNSEYIGRVMKAYDKRRGEVFGKVETMMPKEQSNVREEDKKKYHNSILDKIKNAYNNYKATKKFVIPDNSEYFLFSWLKHNGWIDNTPTTEEDRKKAFLAYIQRAQKGLVKKIEEYKVRRDGTASKELDFPADVNAMRRAIKTAFDKMLDHKIKIEDYLKYK